MKRRAIVADISGDARTGDHVASSAIVQPGESSIMEQCMDAAKAKHADRNFGGSADGVMRITTPDVVRSSASQIEPSLRFHPAPPAESTSKGHILILVENLPVPFDRRTWMEATALRTAGYEVSVISPQPPDDSEPHRVIEGINVYRYPAPAPTRSKFCFVREFAYCFWQTWRLARRIWKEHPFDVIHSCNPPDMFWALALKYKRRGVKYVFDHHDVCPELYLSKFNRRDFFHKGLLWMEKRQFATADAVISTNESYRQVALERGGKSSQDVTVVRSGPSLSRFQAVEPDEALKRGCKNLVVYLGVMGPQDGVDYALRAIRHAIQGGLSDTTFAFIGSGESYDELTRLSRTLGLEKDVLFTGRISDEDLKRYLSTADLALAPDPKNPLNNISTMNKIMEYMAMKLPILSFDLKESKFSAGGAALYVPNNDEVLMGWAMIELLEDHSQRRLMGEIGRKRVELMMAWEHSEKQLVGLYDELLGHADPDERSAGLVQATREDATSRRRAA